tara:strand:+ start:3145 stop:3600 length:456 start_codon:yes stop_codon:yes gene_type:complete
MAWRAITVAHTTDIFASLSPHLIDLCTWVQGTGGAGTAVRQRVVLGEGLSGHPGVLHGGATALLMDDTMGVLAGITGSAKRGELARCGMTASLEVQYKKPCYTGRTLELHAVYDRIEGRKHFLTCEMRECDGPVVATGRSLYLFPKEEEAS